MQEHSGMHPLDLSKGVEQQLMLSQQRSASKHAAQELYRTGLCWVLCQWFQKSCKLCSDCTQLSSTDKQFSLGPLQAELWTTCMCLIKRRGSAQPVGLQAASLLSQRLEAGGMPCKSHTVHKSVAWLNSPFRARFYGRQMTPSNAANSL